MLSIALLFYYLLELVLFAIILKYFQVLSFFFILLNYFVILSSIECAKITKCFPSCVSYVKAQQDRCLLRGVGKMAVLGGLHKENFRRQTVEKMLEAEGNGKIFFHKFEEPLKNDVMDFDHAYVFAKQDLDDFKLEEAKLYYNMITADSLPQMKRVMRMAGCFSEDFLDVERVKRYCSVYTFVFVKEAGRIKEVKDISPDFMKHVVSEHSLFVMIEINELPYHPLERSRPSLPERKITPQAKKRSKAESAYATQDDDEFEVNADLRKAQQRDAEARA